MSSKYENIVYSDKFERLHKPISDSVLRSLCIDYPIDLHLKYFEKSLEILELSENALYLEISNLSFNSWLGGVYEVKFLLSDEKGNVYVITYNLKESIYEVEKKETFDIYNFQFANGVFLQEKYTGVGFCNIFIIRDKNIFKTLVSYNNSHRIKFFFDENEVVNEIFW